MRYFADVKNVEVSNRFKIPTTTISDWAKKQELEDWRGELVDKLKVFVFLQNETTEKLKKLFTCKEMMALWGSLKSTMITMDLVENADFLKFGFADYCVYEDMEAAQFGDIAALSKSVCDKLSKLSTFDRYCLLEYIQNGKDEIFQTVENKES
jgi:hypothetical protein